jgi:hypothetical protein
MDGQVMGLSFTLTTDPACKLDVLGLDCHTLGVDRAHVGVRKEASEVGLTGLLEGHDGVGLETEVIPEFRRHLLHQALKGRLAEQQICGLLVLANFANSHSAGPEPFGLLHTAGGGRGLAGRLGGERLAGRLAAGRLACGLLGAGHL